MRKITGILAAVATAALTTTAAGTQALAETTIRLSTYVNEIDVRYKGFQKFAELVDKVSVVLL